jgi:DNA-binding NarL/FixJ family response regulator
MPTTVVIADDHEIVRQGLGSLFKDSAVRIVAEADNGDAAIKAAKKHKPDVVLLDVRLGDTDGIDAIKRIRAASAETRVVVLSAFDNPTYVARAVSAGAHDYVLKSASRADILAAVTGAADGREPSRSSELRRMVGAMSNRTALQYRGATYAARIPGLAAHCDGALQPGNRRLPRDQRGNGKGARAEPAPEDVPQRPDPGGRMGDPTRGGVGQP